MGEPDAQKNDQTWPSFEGLIDCKTFGPDGLKWINRGGRANWGATLLAERRKSFVLRQAESAGDSVITICDYLSPCYCVRRHFTKEAYEGNPGLRSKLLQMMIGVLVGDHAPFAPA